MKRVFFQRWFTRRQSAVRRPPRPLPDIAADDDMPPKGSAWYDSSLDLKRGLLVRECALQVVIA